jgi:hypothetical protein
MYQINSLDQNIDSLLELSDYNEARLRLERLSRRIYGRCHMNNKPIEFMVDTGADATVIDKKLLDEIGGTLDNSLGSRFVYLGDGQKYETLGRASIDIKLGTYCTQVPVMVFEDLGGLCVLGNDVLATCPATKQILDKLRDLLEEYTDKCEDLAKLE